MRLKSQKIEVLMKRLARSHVQSRAVTCNMFKDVEHRNYPNLSKNTTKIKHNSVFFSLFVSAVGWLVLFLLWRLSGLDCWSSH